MVDFFFAIIELLAVKYDVDASSSSYRTQLATTIIIEIIMVIASVVLLIFQQYWLCLLMVATMIGVYLFSKRRIQELKEESRNVK